MIALVLFLFAVVLVAYLLVGYPLLLAAVDFRKAPAVAKDPTYRTSVSVVMAVHNGAEFLRAKLKTLLFLDYPAELLQIIVVSDGSTDGTDEIVQEHADRGVILLRVPKGGKAAALNAGMARATGEILFFTDVRQLLRADALEQLVANFADSSVGAVTGELYIMSQDDGEQADLDLYWRYEIWARTKHSQIDSLFNTTGCIYAMRRSLAEPLPPDTLTDDAFLPLRAFLRGYRVIFDPAAMAFDYPTATGREFRRRMRTLAGLWQVHARLPQLFTSANRMRLHFLSHKFGRLVLPWALLIALGASLALPPSWFRTAVWAGEALLLGLAMLDPLVPHGWRAKRLSSPARTFLVMNVAALLAILVFVVPPQVLWKPTRVSTLPERES